MNGMQDIGGMDGFGPVEAEKNEPVFHYPWEAKSLGISLVMGGWRKWNLEQTRYSTERFSPRQYLGLSYYERWITGLADRGIAAGLFTAEEVKAGHAAPGSAKLTPPITAQMIPVMAKTPRLQTRQLDTKPLYKIGDRIRTVTDSPEGHTRLPRYARGRDGVVVLYHGAHVFADSNAAKMGDENPQHLYGVRFSARELWGQEGDPRDSVTLDLWEPYIQRG
jgi:nitrile hydratase beta subunit